MRGGRDPRQQRKGSEMGAWQPRSSSIIAGHQGASRPIRSALERSPGVPLGTAPQGGDGEKVLLAGASGKARCPRTEGFRAVESHGNAVQFERFVPSRSSAFGPTSSARSDRATADEANAFATLFAADYNRRFAREPQSPHDAHRPLRPTESVHAGNADQGE
jgi:hypothetical protein